jgi:hypothetical protein
MFGIASSTKSFITIGIPTSTVPLVTRVLVEDQVVVDIYRFQIRDRIHHRMEL